MRRLCKVHHVGKRNGLTDTAENASKCKTSEKLQRSGRITSRDEYWGAKRSDGVETREGTSGFTGPHSFITYWLSAWVHTTAPAFGVIVHVTSRILACSMGLMHDRRISMGEDIKSPTHSTGIQPPQVLYKPPAPPTISIIHGYQSQTRQLLVLSTHNLQTRTLQTW